MLHRLVLSAALFLALVLLPAPARACGGFFCSSSPIDQTGERIIFAINGEAGTITTIVQLAFTGEKHEFAWVVPVPGAPELTTFPQLALNALDSATAVRVELSAECEPRLTLINGGGGLSASTVLVLSTETVGPFDTVVIAGRDPDELVLWLQDNGFNVTEEMRPMIQPYAEMAMPFLALKLTADAEVSDIEPIAMTYKARAPMIPLQLSAVAAEPEMRVTAWILADERWESDNYPNITISDQDIELEQNSHDYYTAVSRRVDEAGGRAFVTDYAGPAAELQAVLASQPAATPEAQEAQAAISELLSGYPYVTRLFTRISAHEMIEDPTFAVSENQQPVSNIRDLSAQSCEESECFDYYCGQGSECREETFEVTDGDIDFIQQVRGCLCAEGTTARAVAHVPSAAPRVFCEPLTSDVLSSTGVDPCQDYDCGAGTCTPMNGNPTCDCDEDVVAQAVTACRDGQVGLWPFCGPMPPVDLDSASFSAFTLCPSQTLAMGGAAGSAGASGSQGGLDISATGGSASASGGALVGAGGSDPSATTPPRRAPSVKQGGCSLRDPLPSRQSPLPFLVLLAAAGGFALRLRARG